MRSIRLIQASRVSQELVSEFLQNNQQIEIGSILKLGYLVEINNKISGCFILDEIEDGLYWLKQLYITKTEAIKIPALVEAILVLARQQNAVKVYVNSHKLMIDIILESLQFHPQEDSKFLERYYVSEGKWWVYNVSG